MIEILAYSSTEPDGMVVASIIAGLIGTLAYIKKSKEEDDFYGR